MKKVFVVLLAIVIGYVLGIAVPAHATPRAGIWLEHVTVADGVVVRKIRDTFDWNICYVVHSQSANLSSSPSISCVPERKP